MSSPVFLLRGRDFWIFGGGTQKWVTLFNGGHQIRKKIVQFDSNLLMSELDLLTNDNYENCDDLRNLSNFMSGKTTLANDKNQ